MNSGLFDGLARARIRGYSIMDSVSSLELRLSLAGDIQYAIAGAIFSGAFPSLEEVCFTASSETPEDLGRGTHLLLLALSLHSKIKSLTVSCLNSYPEHTESFLGHLLEFIFNCEGSFPSLRILKVRDTRAFLLYCDVDTMLSSKFRDAYRAGALPHLRITIYNGS